MGHAPYALELHGRLGTSIPLSLLPIPLGSDSKPTSKTQHIAHARARMHQGTDTAAWAPAPMGVAPAFEGSPLSD